MIAPVEAIRIEDALGVCGVREDTRLLADVAAKGAAPGAALDLGTGSGYVAIYLAGQGWRVDAADVSPRALALAKHNVELNGVAVRVFHSDLFSAVDGPYDVIACNPPMRPDETEGSRLITATLRRAGSIANLFMRVIQPLLERRRLSFLASLARQAASRLAQGGRLVLVISPLEESELPRLVTGLAVTGSRPVDGIPGLNVVTFTFPGAA